MLWAQPQGRRASAWRATFTMTRYAFRFLRGMVWVVATVGAQRNKFLAVFFCDVVCSMVLVARWRDGSNREERATKNRQEAGFSNLVAGAGFEPTTFGL